MSWTNKQKQLAARAWKATGQPDEGRKLLLYQFPNSRFDEFGQATGVASSKSHRLDQGDFEHFMSHCESKAGGQILHFGRNYWNDQAARDGGRLHRRAREEARKLTDAGVFHDAEAGLAGFCAQICDGERDLDKLDTIQVQKVIEGLKARHRRYATV